MCHGNHRRPAQWNTRMDEPRVIARQQITAERPSSIPYTTKVETLLITSCCLIWRHLSGRRWSPVLLGVGPLPHSPQVFRFHFTRELFCRNACLFATVSGAPPFFLELTDWNAAFMHGPVTVLIRHELFCLFLIFGEIPTVFSRLHPGPTSGGLVESFQFFQLFFSFAQCFSPL